MHIFADNPEIFGAKSNNKKWGKSSRQMAYRAVFTREVAYFLISFFHSLILAVNFLFVFSTADLEISYFLRLSFLPIFSLD